MTNFIGHIRRNLWGLVLKLTLFLSPCVLHSCHPSQRRLFRQRRRPAGQIQGREGGVSLGPQQRLGGLGAQRQRQALPGGGEERRSGGRGCAAGGTLVRCGAFLRPFADQTRTHPAFASERLRVSAMGGSPASLSHPV